MTLYNFAALEASPTPEETLSVLAVALGRRQLDVDRRVLADDDGRSPDEGLALLDAYIRIADRSVRQAILDTIIAIADADPYRRSRAVIAPSSNDRGA